MNEEGLVAAEQANALLRTQLPEVDWAQLREQAETEAAQVDLGGTSERKIIAIGVAIVVLIIVGIAMS